MSFILSMIINEKKVSKEVLFFCAGWKWEENVESRVRWEHHNRVNEIDVQWTWKWEICQKGGELRKAEIIGVEE